MQEIILSEMRESDIPLIYKKLHLKYVEKYGKNQQKDMKKAYFQWYGFMLNSPLFFMYTVRNKSEEFIAHVKFEIKGNGAVISLFIDEKFRGKGYSYLLIEEAIDNLLDRRKVKRILAYILKENEISQHIFRKMGFVYEKNGNYNGMRHMVFVKEIEKNRYRN